MDIKGGIRRRRRMDKVKEGQTEDGWARGRNKRKKKIRGERRERWTRGG
jgi:hypothetical protein